MPKNFFAAVFGCTTGLAELRTKERQEYKIPRPMDGEFLTDMV